MNWRKCEWCLENYRLVIIHSLAHLFSNQHNNKRLMNNQCKICRIQMEWRKNKNIVNNYGFWMKRKNLPFQHSLSLLLTCRNTLCKLYNIIYEFTHNVSHLLFKNWIISWVCMKLWINRDVEKFFHAAVIVDLLETTHYPNHIFMRIRIK